MLKKLTILLIVLAILLFARLWFGNGSLPQIWNMQDQLAKMSAKNEAMQARNRKLEAEIGGLKESLDAIEARARNDFGMIKRGESFYQVIIKDKDESTTGTTPNDSKLTPANNEQSEH